MGFEAVLSDAILRFSDLLKSVFYYNVLGIIGLNDIKLPLVIFCIIFTSLFLLVRFRFMNFRYFFYGLKGMLGSSDVSSTDIVSSNKIASIRAVFTAIAGAAGLGSIAGVALAISIGGPGAVVWIILMPFLGMPVRYAEVFLAHKYRVVEADGYDGGPQYYIKQGLKDLGWHKLGIFVSCLYGACLLVSAFGGPCSFQINQAVSVISHNFLFFGDIKVPLSAGFCLIASFVLVGGIGRVSKVLSSVVPIVIAVYFCSSMVVIAVNYKNIPTALHDILFMAFSWHSVYGGILGAFVMGATRAIVASEIGMGTASIVHANVANKSSVKEGLIAMSAPIIEILLISSITGILVTVTDVYKGPAMGSIDVYKAFATVGPWFPYIVMCIVPIMGINVMVAWGFFGERMMSYYLGKIAGKIFIVAYVFAGFVGGIITNIDVMVAFLDTIVATVVFPNLFAILLLSGLVWRDFKDFDPKQLS